MTRQAHAPRKQALVIGLGQFGMSLARSLSDLRVEVLAVDRNPAQLTRSAEFAAESASFDATDEAALATAAPAKRDFCIVAMSAHRESSIICTALLRQLGAPHVIARAADPIHARILRLVGAHEVVNPDESWGQRMARKLLYRGLMDAIPLGDGLTIVELRAPESFVGKTLMDLALPRRYGIAVVAIRRSADTGPGRLEFPRADEPLDADEALVLVASESAMDQVMEWSRR